MGQIDHVLEIAVDDEEIVERLPAVSRASGFLLGAAITSVIQPLRFRVALSAHLRAQHRHARGKPRCGNRSKGSSSSAIHSARVLSITSDVVDDAMATSP